MQSPIHHLMRNTCFVPLIAVSIQLENLECISDAVNVGVGN